MGALLNIFVVDVIQSKNMCQKMTVYASFLTVLTPLCVSSQCTATTSVSPPCVQSSFRVSSPSPDPSHCPPSLTFVGDFPPKKVSHFWAIRVQSSLRASPPTYCTSIPPWVSSTVQSIPPCILSHCMVISPLCPLPLHPFVYSFPLYIHLSVCPLSL